MVSEIPPPKKNVHNSSLRIHSSKKDLYSSFCCVGGGGGDGRKIEGRKRINMINIQKELFRNGNLFKSLAWNCAELEFFLKLRTMELCCAENLSKAEDWNCTVLKIFQKLRTETELC